MRTPLQMLLIVFSLAWIVYAEKQAADPGLAMGEAGAAFLNSLTPEQRQVAQMPFDSPQRLDWHFIPKAKRKGLELNEMTQPQRDLAFALMHAGLSDSGHERSAEIMRFEQLIHELEGTRRRLIRDPLRFYFTVFGEPAPTGRWGLSIEGHHLSLNYVVENGKIISSTPQVFAANPAIVMNENKTGVPMGVRLLADEETLAFDLLNSLNAEQRQIAVLSDKPLPEMREPATPQPPQSPPDGIPYSQLNPQQQAILEKLLKAYCESMPATVRQERIRKYQDAGLDSICFAWMGAQQPGVEHYYRIQGPTLLIEFVNTQHDAAGNPANHIHCIWRDMTGDFGIPIQ